LAIRLEDRDVPAVLTVAPDGLDLPGRGTANEPFRTIQYAVNQAFSGDVILLAGGTYTFDPASAISTESEVNQVVTISNKRLAIYGGYSTTDGFTKSNPQANPTIIDGEGQRRGIYVVGRTVATALDLQGVTIRNGLATPRPGGIEAFSNSAYGGGVFLDMANTDAAKSTTIPFIIQNVTFENNKAVGGGPTGQNEATVGGAGSGGGLFAHSVNDLRLENVIFRNNVAVGGPQGDGQRGGVALGGAIHTNVTKIRANNVLFDGNKALSGSGNGTAANLPFFADATGGAVALQLKSSGTFSNITAVNNQAIGGPDLSTTQGHGGNAYGGAFFTEIETTLTIRDGLIANNLAKGGNGFIGGSAGGGGIETDNSDLILERVRVVNNRAVAGSRTSPSGVFGAPTGGGIYSFRVGGVDAPLPLGSVSLTNVVVAGNRVELPADFPDNEVGFGSGAGIRLSGVDANLEHVTIADNVFSPGLFFGEALMLQSDGAPTPTTVNFKYGIIAGHQTVGAAPVTLFNATTLTLTRTLFFNNTTDTNTGQERTVEIVNLGGGPNTNAGVFNGRNEILSGNPSFFSPGPSDFDYGIRPAGAAANQGIGSAIGTDAGNQPRQGTPDLGAYEVGTLGTLPIGSSATGAASEVGTGPIDSFPIDPLPPIGPSPVLVGYPQFLVGPGRGGGTGVNLYNPDTTLRTGGNAFVDTSFTGGVRTAAADFTGDGIADLIVGTGPGRATQVRILSGIDRAVIAEINPFEATFTGGVYVAAGDLTGDGVPDLVITPDEGGGPRVRVFNGRGFTQIVDFFGIDDPNFRGGARAAVGDINGDGVGDLVVAAGFQGGPRIAAFNGKSLATDPVKLFNDFFAFEQTLRNGVFIAVGDLDGDGKAEIIAGGGPGGGPRVTAFSGADLIASGGGTLTQLANFFGGDPSNRGGIRVAVKNLDGDDRADIVVGAGTGAGPRVTAYLGKNIIPAGTPPEHFAFDAFPSNFTGGVFVG
jgi:hypothetical protein